MMHVMPWLHLPLGAYTLDMAEAKRSIIKAAALKPQTLGVGHGAPLVGNALAPIDKLAKLDVQKTWRKGSINLSISPKHVRNRLSLSMGKSATLERYDLSCT